jgi:hypothetical protein
MASKPGTNSPYSASFTGAAMLFSDMNVAVKLLLEDDSPETIKTLRTDASYIQIKSAKSRERVTAEFVKRFRAVPQSFWSRYVDLPESEQRLALLYVILKTYRLLFEFQVNLAIPKYNSPDRIITKNDVNMALNEIASQDEFVDSWSAETRDRASSQYLTILRQSGLIDEGSGELQSPYVPDEAFLWYIQAGEVWFLQACFLPGYKIEQIKQLAL